MFFSDEKEWGEEPQNSNSNSNPSSVAVSPMQTPTKYCKRAQKMRSNHKRNLNSNRGIQLVGNSAIVLMTVKILKQICRRKGLYETCSINDVLYLNFEAFTEIHTCLQDNYYNIKSLFMEGNSIHAIQNLEKLTKLKGLYLQSNVLTRIENIGMLRNLAQLDLSNNRISKIESKSFQNLSNLDSLILKNNLIADVDEIRKVVNSASGKNISCLDLSGNQIESEEVVDLLSAMPNLKLLYLKGNPFLNVMDFYRKKTVAKLRSLTFLDERPVFENERRLNDAWVRGGTPAENAEKLRIAQEKRDRKLKTKLERKQKYELRKAAMMKRVQREKEERDAKESALVVTGEEEKEEAGQQPQPQTQPQTQTATATADTNVVMTAIAEMLNGTTTSSTTSSSTTTTEAAVSEAFSLISSAATSEPFSMIGSGTTSTVSEAWVDDIEVESKDADAEHTNGNEGQHAVNDGNADGDNNDAVAELVTGTAYDNSADMKSDDFSSDAVLLPGMVEQQTEDDMFDID